MRKIKNRYYHFFFDICKWKIDITKNKKKLKKVARKKYQNFSEERKNKMSKKARNRYHNISKEEKEKKS